MQPFLKEAAQDIVKKYPDNISGLCFVVPNKRTGVFFRKYYGEVSGKTTWSPDIFTTNRFVQRYAHLRVADRLSLLFDLHQSVKAVAAKQSNPLERSLADYSFDRFFHIGEIMLADINEVDSYLADVKQLFGNIRDMQQLSMSFEYFDELQKQALQKFWANFSPEKRSAEKEKFLALWNIFPKVYEHFRNALLKRGIAYEGLVYRKLAALIEKDELRIAPYHKVVFLGFNALNSAQEKLFAYLDRHEKALFYWDTDQYYQNDAKQEAGFFMRRNIKMLGKNAGFTDIPANFLKEKQVEIIGVPQNVGQAKALSSILKQLGIDRAQSHETNQTAVVLADEQMMFPVLHSLPQSIEKINVTMGFPLTETPLFSLIQLYLRMQLALKRRGAEQNVFYHKDVIAILRHPDIWSKNAEKAHKIIETLEKQNKVYVETTLLLAQEEPVYDLLFLPATNPDLLFENLLNLLFVLFTQGKEPENTEKEDAENISEQDKDETINRIEDEYIYQMYISIKRLREILQLKSGSVKQPITIEMAVKLINQLLANARIPFTGEPLEGLQVMGVLETRNLDFKNLVVLGVNEGIFPDISRAPTFISENLRRAFDLPTIKYQDAIFAYYFYRLLQRAQRIFLLYNNIPDEQAGEKSRFILQIMHESGLKINERQLVQPLNPARIEPVSIQKNDEILNLLRRYLVHNNQAVKRLSASALNTYLDCRLKFYFQQVAEIKEPQVVEEEISPITFGNILHKSMELLYSPYKQKEIRTENFKEITSRIDENLETAFREEYFGKERKKAPIQGSNLVIKEVLKTHIQNILQHDKNYAPFEIFSLEKQYFTFFANLPLVLAGENVLIGLKGVIDRVDKKNGTFRVIDYKTGSADKKFSSVEGLFVREAYSQNKTVFQALFYALLAKQNRHFRGKPTDIGVYDIRSMSNPDFSPAIFQKMGRKQPLRISAGNIKAFLAQYEPLLAEVVAEIFDPDTPFDQTNDNRKCMYCPYRRICSR